MNSVNALRVQTSFKTALSILITLCVIVFVDPLRDSVSGELIVAIGILLLLLNQPSVMVLIKNGRHMIWGAFFGSLVGYIFGYLIAQKLHWSLSLFFLFVFSFLMTAHEKGLDGGHPGIYKFAVIGFLPIAFQPGTDARFYEPFVFLLLLAIAFFIRVMICMFLWPDFSSRQYLVEVVEALELCKEFYQNVPPDLNSDPKDKAQQKGKKKDVEVDADADYDDDNEGGLVRDDKSNIAKTTLAIEQVLSRKITRLSKLLREAKLESWQEADLKDYERFQSALERIFHRLVTLRSAILAQTSHVALADTHLAGLLPLLPRLSGLTAELTESLIVLVAEPIQANPAWMQHSTSDRLANLVAEIENTYSGLMKHQRESNTAPEQTTTSPYRSAEISRFVFFLTRQLLFTKELLHMEGVIKKVVMKRTWSSYGILYKYISSFGISNIRAATASVLGNLGGLVDESKKFSLGAYLKTNSWHYPLRVASGIVTLAFVMLIFQDISDHDIAIWPGVAFTIIIQPYAGATLRGCLQRIAGAMVGAIFGFIFGRASLLAPVQIEPILFALSLLTCVILTSYVSLLPKYSHMGTIAGVAFVTLQLTIYLSGNWLVPTNVFHTAAIVVGVLWVFFVNTVVFPSKPSQRMYLSVVEVVGSVSKLFAQIVDSAVSGSTPQNKVEIAKMTHLIPHQFQMCHDLYTETLAELFINAKKMSAYKKALAHAQDAYFALLSLNSVVRDGSSAGLREKLINPLATPLNNMVPPVVYSTEIFTHAINKQPRENLAVPPSLSDSLSSLDDQYFQIVKKLNITKQGSEMFAEISTFHSFLTIMREYVKLWIMTEGCLYEALAIEPSTESRAPGAHEVVEISPHSSAVPSTEVTAKTNHQQQPQPGAAVLTSTSNDNDEEPLNEHYSIE